MLSRKEIDMPLGTETRMGIGGTKQTTVKELMESIQNAIDRAYEAGRALTEEERTEIYVAGFRQGGFEREQQIKELLPDKVRREVGL
jgi:hypothetical protein